MVKSLKPCLQYQLTGFLLLYGWAWHIAIRTIHTAIPHLGFKYGMASRTLIKPLASIGWHGFLFAKATLWARDG